MKNIRLAIYTRVSTNGQTVDNQLLKLRALAERHGWEVVEVLLRQWRERSQGAREARRIRCSMQSGYPPRV